jgi:hypothetical protein
VSDRDRERGWRAVEVLDHAFLKFAQYLTRLAEAQGDRAASRSDGEDVIVEQSTWRLMDAITPLPDAAFDAWNELWVGALSVHHRRLVLDVERRLDRGDGTIRWRIHGRGGPRYGPPHPPAFAAPGVNPGAALPPTE